MARDERVAAVRGYYRALDEHAYDDLAALLAPEFVHDRPDMLIEGKHDFVAFMRDERPLTGTTHPLDAVYEGGDGTLAARGELLDSDDAVLTGFVDVFAFEGDTIAGAETYVDR